MGVLYWKCLYFLCFFFFFSIANLSFPGTSSFIGELLVLLGAAEKNISMMVIAAGGMLFSSIYSMWLFNRVMYGTLKLVYIKKYCDILRREFFILIPLFFLTVYLGIIPSILLETTYFSVKVWTTYLII